MRFLTEQVDLPNRPFDVTFCLSSRSRPCTLRPSPVSFHKKHPETQTTMLSRTFPRALPRLNRTLASSPRAYSTHPAHSGAQGSGNQSMGEDTADIQRKNAAVPVFIGLGVVTVG